MGALAAGGLLLSACGQKQTTGFPQGLPQDYFPIAVGTRWNYEITIGKDASGKLVEPLMVNTVVWPTATDSAISYLTKGRFRVLLEKDPPKTFTLSITVANQAPKQGPLKYPTGVELKVDKDDLGVFEEARNLYWAINDSQRYQVTQVTTYPPDTMGAPSGPWGRWGTQDGYSLRPFFFGERPGFGISIGEKSPDTLYFKGQEGSDLHFERIVEGEKSVPTSGATPSDGLLDAGFSEHMWFRKGIGLSRLEQIIGGKTSMTWELVRP